MKSSRRLQHIFRIIKKYHSEVVHSKASTLFINYLETFDLQNIDLPNIYNYTTLKKQQIDAQILGLKTLDDKKKYDLVITSIPKSREEALGQIALAYQQTKIGGILVLEGRKRNGIESIIKVLLNKLRIHQLISKAHGKFAVIKVEFETINIISKWLTYTIPAKNKDGFYSMPGLFSYKTIDPVDVWCCTRPQSDLLH